MTRPAAPLFVAIAVLAVSLVAGEVFLAAPAVAPSVAVPDEHIASEAAFDPDVPCDGLAASQVVSSRPGDEQVEACATAMYLDQLERYGASAPCHGAVGGSTTVTVLVGIPTWWEERFESLRTSYERRCAGQESLPTADGGR